MFLTAHCDIPMAVQAGAMDFIQKPFRDQELLDKIHAALAADRRLRLILADRRAIAKRLATLTPREREVMERVVAGRPNKVVAADLGLSQRTVEIHRARVMKKMQAHSVPELVLMVLRAREAEQPPGGGG